MSHLWFRLSFCTDNFFFTGSWVWLNCGQCLGILVCHTSFALRSPTVISWIAGNSLSAIHMYISNFHYLPQYIGCKYSLSEEKYLLHSSFCFTKLCILPFFHRNLASIPYEWLGSSMLNSMSTDSSVAQMYANYIHIIHVACCPITCPFLSPISEAVKIQSHNLGTIVIWCRKQLCTVVVFFVFLTMYKSLKWNKKEHFQ